MVAWMPICPCQEVVRTCLTCTAYIISIDIYCIAKTWDSFPSISIHFHPCPCLQEAFRPTSSHPKFFHLICPQNLVARFQLFSDASGPGPQAGQGAVAVFKAQKGLRTWGVTVPGKNGGFMRCGDINYYLGILGLRLGRFLGGKPLKSDYTITPHNGSHTPAYNWNCDLKDDDEP